MIVNEPIVNRTACFTVIRPAGIERSLVRGLRASILASINLFSVIDAARAPAKAAIVQKTVASEGQAADARSSPERANGRAKTVCSSLIISDHSAKSPRAGGLVDWLSGSVALFIRSDLGSQVFMAV